MRGLPVARMDEYASRARQALHAQLPGAQSLFYGHIGDGNLHIIVYQPGADPQPKDQVNALVYGLVREYGGTVSAEHGIGTLKREWLRTRPLTRRDRADAAHQERHGPQGAADPGKVL